MDMGTEQLWTKKKKALEPWILSHVCAADHPAEEPIQPVTTFQVILIDILKAEFSCKFYAISQLMQNRIYCPQIAAMLDFHLKKKKKNLEDKDWRRQLKWRSLSTRCPQVRTAIT